jgi:hypothetical protein
MTKICLNKRIEFKENVSMRSGTFEEVKMSMVDFSKIVREAES